jgi:hypothetical protein
MSGFGRALLSGASILVVAGLVYAQRGGGDWMTIGYDAQRSSWVRGDGKITPETMRKPGFELLWKVKMNNVSRHLNSITPPALLDFYIGYKGFRTLGFFGGSSNNVIAIDTDLARLEWERALADKAARLPAGDMRCPGGMTTSVTRPTSAGYPAPVGLRGFGRSGPAKSGVGEPLEGSVVLKERLAQRPGPPPQATRPNRRTAPAGNPFARSPLFVLAITADGKLHSMYVSNGEEPKPAVPFLPANANAVGLVAFDGTAYAATVNGCAGVPDGVWAISLESGKVTQWKAGANIAGNAGFAAGPEGVLYVAAGSKLVALEPGTLKEKATYSADQTLISTPVVFDNNGKDLVVVAAADGSLHLLDGDSLGAVAKSASGVASDFAGSLASWQDDAGVRWVLAAGKSAVTALKVVEKGGKPGFESGWVSANIAAPLTPAVVNGVVFAVSSGVVKGTDSKSTAAKSSKAVLHALDGLTGKEFWNSGAAITSFVYSGGLAAGGGRIYVSSHDGTQYAFGFPMEH